ncbi:transcription initiation factor IIB [Blastocladiella emersonii ATCC 22665]|nr:transcription initiation factor IIB [Blastocladiella emersonii ATCC 22665]
MSTTSALNAANKASKEELYRSVQPQDAEDAKYAQTTQVQQQDLNVRLVCTYCKKDPPNVIEDFKQGDLVCADCGTVFKDRIIDTRSEWRTFSADEGGDDPSRVGSTENALMGSMNMETTINDARGGTSGPGKDLSKAHAKTSSIRDHKVVLQGFKEVGTLGEKLGLPKNYIDTAKQYFRTAVEKDLNVQKRVAHYAGACLLLGCRKHGVTRTIDEFARMLGIKKHEFGRLLLQVNKTVANLARQETIDTGARLCDALDLPASSAQLVTEVSRNARDIDELASRVPGTIQGAAALFVSQLIGMPRSVKDISVKVDVAETTIKVAFRLMLQHRDRMLSKDNAAKYATQLAALYDITA